MRHLNSRYVRFYVRRVQEIVAQQLGNAGDYCKVQMEFKESL